jgi:hypothetical protein
MTTPPPPLPGDDDPVVLAAEALLDCLCELLEASRRGPVCACCFYPGQVVPTDRCCQCDLPNGTTGEGMAFVHVVRIFRSTGSFPELAAVPDECGGGWGAVLNIGVYRCAATITDDGDPPSCEQIEDDAKALMSDAAAMRRAASCCFPNLLGEMGGGRYLLGEYSTIGPDGGCMGGRLQVTVEFADCCP